LLIGKTALLKKCKSTQKRIRNQDFELVSLTKEFMTDSRGEAKRQVRMAEQEEKKMIYNGEEVIVRSRNIIENKVKQSAFVFRRKNGNNIGRTVLKILDEETYFNLEPQSLTSIRKRANISTQFLTCIPNGPARELIIYEFDENVQMKKTMRVVEWSEDNPEFDRTFVNNLYDLLEVGNKLSFAQEKALDNIIDKWRIP
jgi:hypothetical protein